MALYALGVIYYVLDWLDEVQFKSKAIGVSGDNLYLMQVFAL